MILFSVRILTSRWCFIKQIFLSVPFHIGIRIPNTQVNKKQIYDYFIHALNYSIQDKMDSVLSEHDNINKNNHPVSIFCRTKVIIGQINQLGWNMVLLTLLNLAKIVNFAKFCSFQVINLSKISKK